VPALHKVDRGASDPVRAERARGQMLIQIEQLIWRRIKEQAGVSTVRRVML
jgi:hypothetical protein